jgi:hypothetical protein
MPWKQFRWLVETARVEGWFPHHEQEDATGRRGVPLDLLILGSLRYLGRGWTFDDLEEATGISEETHRAFFHSFCEVGARILFPRYGLNLFFIEMIFLIRASYFFSRQMG